MQFLKCGTIKPNGWLKKQLEIQAKGLSGNLDKMWPDVKDSQWIGGTKEGWERVPYWLDGFIPLAYILDDEDMKNRAKKFIDAIIARQEEDGWLCPCKFEERKTYDLWALFLILKVFVVYYDCSGDERIEGVIYRALKRLFEDVKLTTLFGWATSRWYEVMIAIKWLYERKNESWLIELANRICTQGADYTQMTKLWNENAVGWSFEMHVVNAAMAIKGKALYNSLIGEPLGNEAELLFQTLQKYHGTVVGHFNGDECLAGTSPTRGTELCGVVEAMYSYEWLYLLTGDKIWAERLEMLAFNALPATISDDMWTHQYLQLVNQIACINFPDKPIYSTNSEESNVFGLEPHFGCCTANFNQGFPKFVSSLVCKEGTNYSILSCVPFEATDMVNGKQVKITCNSEYPFRKTIKIKVENNSDSKLNVSVCVPKDANAKSKLKNKNGKFIIVAKQGVTEVEITIEPKVKFVERPSNMSAVKYGSLIFSLPIDEKREMREYVRDNVERKFPYCDYDIYPTSNWQYAYSKDAKFEVIENEYENAFSRKNPPLYIKTDLIPIEWEMNKEHRFIASDTPSNVVTGEKQNKCLQPYGATTLRMTEMPKL